MRYSSTITGIGDMAMDFLSAGFIIIFNDNAPAELAELSVLHTIKAVEQDIRTGDTVIIGGKKYSVTAVGEEANKTFKTMGHCTLKFTGMTEAELPGHIELEGEGNPDIRIGDVIEIIYR